MTINAHTRACNDCKLSIKTYQNVAGALNGFDRLLTLNEAEDHILLSSVFCFAVIKYAKSFIDNETSFGNIRYPIKHLKKIENFSLEIHKHLLELRNTLVAHDDFESIEPRIIHLFMSLEGTDFPIPMSIAVSNKCLAYPIDLEGVHIPPMLAQPFIENAIEHGIFYKKEKGRVDVRLYFENYFLIYEIEDDGVGMEEAMKLKNKLKSSYESLATIITKERMSNLNEQTKNNFQIEILDKKTTSTNSGVKVTFIVPFKEI